MSPRELFEEAGKYLGLQEVPGDGSNPVIDQWLLDYGTNVNPNWVARKGDSIAWCSVYVGKVVHACGLEPTYHALARSWTTWGRPGKFTPGAIVVIRRRDRQSDGTSGRGGFHVGFFKKMNKRFLWLRGGNQSNTVSDAAFSKKNYEIVAIRVPRTSGS